MLQSRISDHKSCKTCREAVSYTHLSDQYAYGDAWENTHVYNSLAQFVNFWGGDYFDWTDPKTKDAARYMKSMLDEKNTSPAQFVDQYEQMEEKFIRGKYGCVFMYTSALGTFLDADVYGKNKIHMAPLPMFHEKKSPNIATCLLYTSRCV